MAIDFKEHIASVKDFPNKGIIFRDITPNFARWEAISSCYS